MNNKGIVGFGMAVGLSALLALNNQTARAQESTSHAPLFVVNVTTRTVEAISYQHRSGESKVDFAGSDLMPAASGEASVKSNRGSMAIEAEFKDLRKPTSFGNEYLTYVLWAISPEGRAVNLGEVLVGNNHRSKLNVTTDLQAFAMIVTAEPYYAVHEPSNVVVLENVVREDTKGTSEAVHAKYELMERGSYIPTGYKFDPVVLDAKLPLEFLEARNALRIAKSEGAEAYAADSYQHAAQLMNTADTFATTKHSSKKELIATSREAVQTAEDSRAIAVKKMDEERRAGERAAAANAQAESQAQAENATLQKEQAEAEAAKSRAEAAKAQADMAASQAAAAIQVSTANADAEQSRRAADVAQQNEHQADADKAAMRTKLSEQLNKVLETRDSARGLIVSMSDVLFDSGKFSLKPGAREKLAKVAGILIAYPGLAIEVGGYTDNVGADNMNQKLSEDRAGAVRAYLVEQGVAAPSVTMKGFGNTSPVASNDTASGRQQNRRVELVVSGDAIGNPTAGAMSSIQ